MIDIKKILDLKFMKQGLISVIIEQAKKRCIQTTLKETIFKF